MNRERVTKLLQYILLVAGQNDDNTSRRLGEIHLIKYVYLADFEYAKYNAGQTYTGLPWRFYKFGPYCEDVLRGIKPALDGINAREITVPSSKYQKDFTRWECNDDRLLRQLHDEMEINIDGIIQKMVRKYSSDTEGLLRHVYNTTPMLAAAPNERLSFDLVAKNPCTKDPDNELFREPGETLSVRQKKLRRNNILAFKDKMREKPNRESRKITPHPPRYDHVFFEGLEWLDSLAGEPITPVFGEITISSDVWKSTSRFDPEGIDGELS